MGPMPLVLTLRPIFPYCTACTKAPYQHLIFCAPNVSVSGLTLVTVLTISEMVLRVFSLIAEIILNAGSKGPSNFLSFLFLLFSLAFFVS